MSSNGNLGKSIICALQKNGRSKDERWMEYYVSDEKESSEIGESFEENEEKGDIIGPQLGIKGSYFYASYIVFKSCLYRIGGWGRDEYGGDKASKTVNKLDLNNIDSGWVKVEGMNCGRKNPYTVILGGKLYVVGGLMYKPEEETAHLMEVFESDEFGWKTICNPPLPPDQGDKFMVGKEVRKIDNRYFRQAYMQVIAGGVESETSDFIIVFVPGEGETYHFYTYEAKEKIWKPYTKLTSENLSDKDFSYSGISKQPAVVSGQLMLFIEHPEILYVMDIKNGRLCTIDLLNSAVIDKDRLHSGLPPYLVMIEEGKFCVFWAVVGPKSKNTGKVYSILKGCIFTLKRKRKNKRKTFKINKISSCCSLLPDLTTHTLQAVCLVDFIPEF